MSEIQPKDEIFRGTHRTPVEKVVLEGIRHLEANGYLSRERRQRRNGRTGSCIRGGFAGHAGFGHPRRWGFDLFGVRCIVGLVCQLIVERHAG